MKSEQARTKSILHCILAMREATQPVEDGATRTVLLRPLLYPLII